MSTIRDIAGSLIVVVGARLMTKRGRQRFRDELTRIEAGQ